jgi:hypothetical protein
MPTEIWKELDVTVVAVVEGHSVDFKVYEVQGWVQSESGEWDVPEYEAADAKDFGDSVDSPEGATPLMQGYVKWDGCSNWSFPSTEKCMYHACGRPGLTRVGEVMARCWDWTAQILPAWDKTITAEQRA